MTKPKTRVSRMQGEYKNSPTNKQEIKEVLKAIRLAEKEIIQWSKFRLKAQERLNKLESEK